MGAKGLVFWKHAFTKNGSSVDMWMAESIAVHSPLIPRSKFSEPMRGTFGAHHRRLPELSLIAEAECFFVSKLKGLSGLQYCRPNERK